MSAPLRNACTRAQEQLRELLMTDRDGLSAAYAPDAYAEDRRRGLGWRVDGRDAVLEHLRVAAAGATIREDVVATRGEQLALFRQVATTAPDFEVTLLQVTEIDDSGRQVGTVLFDADDLHNAFTELNERFEAGEGALFAANLRLHTALVHALDSKHPEHLRDLLAHDFVFVDHRPASFGELDPDGWIAIQAELLALVDEQWTHVVAFHVLTSDAHVASVLNAGRTLDGAPFEISFVGLRTVRDGKHTRIELFPDGEIDAARVRLAELTAASG